MGQAEKRVTGEAIWKAMSAESTFQADVPKSAHGVFRELCDAAVEAFEPFLNQVITLEVFAEAKCATVRFLMNGWNGKILGAYPDEVFLVLDRESFIATAEEVMEMLLVQMEEVKGQLRAMLAENGVTEEMFFASENGGRFTSETMAKWKAGGFTIGDLLITQPSSLFKMNV